MIYIISIDIGGTHLRSGLVSKNGNIINYIKTTSTKNIIDDIINHVLNIEIFWKNNYLNNKNYILLNKIGISIGGCVDRNTGEILYVDKNIGKWKKNNIKEKLNLYFKNEYDIQIDNDGNCALYAEKIFGNAINCDNFIVIVLGTGIGIGCYINNKIIQHSEIGYTIEDKCSGKYFDSLKEKLNKSSMNKVYNNGAYVLGCKIAELIKLLNLKKVILNGPLLEISNEFKNIIHNTIDNNVPDFLQYEIIFSNIKNQGILGASTLFI